MEQVMHVKREVATYSDMTVWYDDYYHAHGTWPTSEAYAERLMQFLFQAGLQTTSQKRLLDIACGGGFFLGNVGPSFLFACGCDISRVALRESQGRHAELPVCLANGEALPFCDRSFDVITCLGSLEHFLQPEHALKEMSRIVRPDGLVLILVPTNPDWAVYDVQPTEVIMEAAQWGTLIERAALQVVVSVATDQDDALRVSSAGCHVYCARPRVL